jgi:hypothetical protein
MPQASADLAVSAAPQLRRRGHLRGWHFTAAGAEAVGSNLPWVTASDLNGNDTLGLKFAAMAPRHLAGHVRGEPLPTLAPNAMMTTTPGVRGLHSR